MFLFYSNIRGQEGTNLAAIANRIDDYLTKSTSNGYSGSVLIAKDGEIILSKPNTGESIQDKAILNRIRLKQISEGKNADWGIALLQQNVRLFPDDGNLWDTLGEGYYLLNNKNSAIESFQKAMELKPETDCYWREDHDYT